MAEFHFLQVSPDGWTGRPAVAAQGDPPAEAPVPGPAKAMTAVSRVLIREVTSGSGSLCWEHSRSVWVEAKQISHLRARVALPVKHIEYRVVLIADHFLFPVSAA